MGSILIVLSDALIHRNIFRSLFVCSEGRTCCLLGVFKKKNKAPAQRRIASSVSGRAESKVANSQLPREPSGTTV